MIGTDLDVAHPPGLMEGAQVIDTLATSTADYRFSAEAFPHRVHATFAGVVVVDSDAALLFRETRLPPVYYFPKAHVRMDLMRPTSRRTHCPFKGNARYWSLEAGARVAENVMWSYEDPHPDAHSIKGYVAFYADMLDGWFNDATARPGTDDSPATGFTNPLLPWLLSEAPLCSSSKELTEQFTQRMLDVGIPIWRANIIIRTLHPQLMAVSYRWWRKSAVVDEILIPFEVLQRPQYLSSPLVPIIEGAGGIRRRLDIADPVLDYPILEELHAEGGTDYVAMPMVFSDGQINVVSLASAERGGFSTSDLGHIYEILAVLARLYEVHAMRYRASTLLDTYLGRHAGQRVLDGRIKRGDGETIEAVLWFCDLRQSTPLARSMPRDEFLRLLNGYFDCMAGAVLEHGGQVLRFIGDAALAIFPVGPGGMSEREARAASVLAARDACKRMAVLNRARIEQRQAALGFGIALHQGEVTYGNIGTENRLEFTVIGDAANRAARVESMCKELGRYVLATAEIARHASEQFESLGHHTLRGVDAPVELFALTGIEA